MLSKLSVLTITFALIFSNFSVGFAQTIASPSSSHFIIEQYGFGSGGIASASSANYLFSGLSGEVETASLSSTNFIALPGLTYTEQPNIPAPSVTNPSSYYNKLHIVVNPANYPNDTTFAIQVSSGSADFSQNVYYVQNDNTLGGPIYFQTYSLWGSATGFDLIGLYPGTTYYIRAAAKRGVYQQGPWSATANGATINSTFSFNIVTTSQGTPPFSVNIGQVNAGAITTSSDKVTVTISTNATNGGLVYLYGANTGLKTSYANYTIGSSTTNLTGATEGYGARGTTVTQTSGGPMELVSPYAGSGNNVGILDTSQRLFADSTQTPVTSGQASFELQAKASSTTPSAPDYTDTITVIGTGSF